MHTVTSIYVLCVYMFACNYMVTLYVRMMAFSLDYCNFPQADRRRWEQGREGEVGSGKEETGKRKRRGDGKADRRQWRTRERD